MQPMYVIKKCVSRAAAAEYETRITERYGSVRMTKSPRPTEKNPDCKGEYIWRVDPS